MSTLISVGIKVADLVANDKGYANITLSVENEANQWGQNVAAWNNQTKEERDAKTMRKYCGNGKVVWTDVDGINVPVVEKEVTNSDFNSARATTTDLPF
tara:strand:- start:229 stop:525 length:297 start_codon:yes stop_codon:yes gene_type:complete